MNSRTNIDKVGCVLCGNMSEPFSSLINPGSRLWVIGIDALDGDVKIDKVLRQITK
jgi:hypothetical protein